MPDNLPTSQPIPNVLPDAWVDKLFARFAAMYGKHWFDQWADVPMIDVKAVWRADLAKMTGEQIRKALDHCKVQSKFPPTCPEFVGMCKSFAIRDSQRVIADSRKGDIPPEVQAEIAKMFDTQRKRDPKDWARKVLQLEAEGSYPSHCGVQMAKQALGIA